MFFSLVEDAVIYSDGVYFKLPIKWNVAEIAACECANGYIVQHMCIESEIDGIASAEYYEAWRVINGVVDEPGDEMADDIWESTNAMFAGMFRDTTGSIRHKSDVYWFPEKNCEHFSTIDSWERNYVAEAGKLKASLRLEIDREELKKYYVCSRSHNHQW